ncbi:winged helix-turn-helix domain-containing protein [uncultured Methanolobus sp.]|uniref:helix-turn-helix transcriptional regulator n=1 Tax=uncultured Methanolobus sp. TaxID=218300 RepID=UPI0029C6F0EE|nr:winged helix-turn-helix domain-containing protein [uncultured Methanolobus sp.]
MKRQLLDVIFTSEKRKNTLLSLKDGPKEINFLLKSLDTTRHSLLPQIRVLEDSHLVDHKNDIYKLTTIGKLIVERMIPLLNSVETFETDIDYWGTHNLNFIPPYLLKRLEELQKCEVIRPSHVHIYDLNETVMKSSFESEFMCGLCTFYHPHFPKFFSGLMEKDADVYFVTTPEVLNKLRKECIADFEELLKNKLFHFYVCSAKMDFLAVVYNNYHLLMRPLTIDGEVDTQYVLCFSPEALKWANDLFEHYLSQSKSVTEI